MQATTARAMPWTLTPFSWVCAVSSTNPCLNRMMQARARMQATEAASSTRVRMDDTRMSLKAMNQPATALTAKKMIGGTEAWKPSASSSCWQKTAKPHMPATAMNR